MSSSIFFHKGFCRVALASAVALAAFGASNSFAVDATTNSSATVIEPIAINKTADLIFGEFAPGAGGTVTVATDGSRTASGPILSTAGPTPTAAKFDVTGEADATYGISYSGAVVLTDSVSTETMALTRISDLDASGTTSGEVTAGTLDVNGAQSVYLGGTLAVTATQAAGTYLGDITVTVEYN